MGTDQSRPRQRTGELVARVQGAENLILDRRTETVHCLSAEASRVWAACTGGNTVAQIAAATGVNEQAVASAIDQLTDLELLEVPAGVDRRKLLQRTAVIGAGAVTFAGITSVVGPMATAAASVRSAVIQTTPAVTCIAHNAAGFAFFNVFFTVTLFGFSDGDYAITVTANAANTSGSGSVQITASGMVTTAATGGTFPHSNTMTLVNVPNPPGPNPPATAGQVNIVLTSVVITVNGLQFMPGNFTVSGGGGSGCPGPVA